MLSRSGGRPGLGGGFDEINLPVVGTFDQSSSPGDGLLINTVSGLGSSDAILDFRRRLKMETSPGSTKKVRNL